MKFPTSTRVLEGSEPGVPGFGFSRREAFGPGFSEGRPLARVPGFCGGSWGEKYPCTVGCPRMIFMFLIWLALVPAGFSQSRKELEDKRLRLIEEIGQTTRKLQETQKTKAATLDRYLALKSQVDKRRQLLATMQEEIAHADSAIMRSEEVMQALEDDIIRLRGEYARTLRTAWRLRLQQSWVAFIFSAENLNHAFRRRQYMRQYERYRRRQALLITETQQMLAAKVEQLEKHKAEQRRLMESTRQQGEFLRQEMLDKNRTLQSLKADETRLVKELERREKERELFSAAIEGIIREEMAQKRREARSASAIVPSGRSSTEAASASEATLAADKSAFGSSRGSLPWPVSGGRISRPFGPQPHPTLKGVTVPNNGVDISAAAGANVSAVFEGKVVGVQFIPGYQNMVLVQHGAYYTVYSNLSSLLVRRGDVVKAGQPLGNLGQEDLHFEVWREKTRLNPAGWLK